MNTIISSNLFINSGGNLYFNYLKADNLAYSNTYYDYPAASIKSLLPILLVNIIIVFVKSTRLPLPSYNLPSSHIYNNTFNTF